MSGDDCASTCPFSVDLLDPNGDVAVDDDEAKVGGTESEKGIGMLEWRSE
jgi:hypothetical protein